MRGAFLGLLAPAAGVLLSAGIFAQDRENTSWMDAEGDHAFRGVVTLDREPLSNIVVELTLACGSPQAEGGEGCHPRRAFTDEEGRILIEGLAAGTYVVLVKCPDSDQGFQTDVTSSTSESDFILDCHVHQLPPCQKFQGKIRWAR